VIDQQITLNRDESEQFAKTLATQLTKPCAVLLSGDLGAGKTQFVRWLVVALGESDAASPTFAIHHRYGSIDHLDLYRLTSDADLESTGFWDLLTTSDALLLVEWADRLPESIWPESWLRVFVNLQVGRSAEERVVSVRFKRPGSKSE